MTSNIHAALEDTVPPNMESYSCGNSTSAEYDAPQHQQHASSINGSPTAQYSFKAYSETQTRLNPVKTATSLSFRQYILMPLFFFLALLLVWVAPSTNRVASFVDPTFSSYPLLLTVGVTGSLRGFWNGIVFVVVGMRSWRRRKESDEVALRPVSRG